MKRIFLILLSLCFASLMFSQSFKWITVTDTSENFPVRIAPNSVGVIDLSTHNSYMITSYYTTSQNLGDVITDGNYYYQGADSIATETLTVTQTSTFDTISANSAAIDTLTVDSISSRVIRNSENISTNTLQAWNITGTGTTALDTISGTRLDLDDGGKSVFIGLEAGLDDDGTNNENTFIGWHSGGNITSGAYNTAIGSLALYDQTTVSSVVAIGKNAGRYTTGNCNTIIGTSSAINIAAAEYGVYIGQETDGVEGTTNQIVIGANAIGNGSNTVTLGDDNVTDIYMGEDGTAIIHGILASTSDSLYLHSSEKDTAWDEMTFMDTTYFKSLVDIDANVDLTGVLQTDGTVSGGSSVGSLVKLTQAAGETYSGTTAGLTVKNYDIATAVHGSGENTGLAVFMKQLSLSGAGGENSLASFHSHSSAMGKLDHGLVMYPDTVGSVFAVRAAVIDYGLDFYDAANVVVNNAELRGSNGETLDNTVDGTWSAGTAIIKAGEFMLGTDYKIEVFNDTLCGIKISTTDTVRIVPPR